MPTKFITRDGKRITRKIKGITLAKTDIGWYAYKPIARHFRLLTTARKYIDAWEKRQYKKDKR